MHLPDGFLDPKMSTGLIGAALGVVGMCLARVWQSISQLVPQPALAAVGNQFANLKRQSRRMLSKAGEKKLLNMGVVAAFIFAAQMFNFPIASGTSGHFVGGVLAAVLLGPFAGVIVISSVLIAQSAFFADGGLMALGANIINMAVIGSLICYFLYAKLNQKLPEMASIGIAAWASVVLAALLCALEVGFSGTIGLKEVTVAMLKVHVLIGIAEAVITIFAVKYLRKNLTEE
jgi:cobalt/nickel transport system permease protein